MITNFSTISGYVFDASGTNGFGGVSVTAGTVSGVSASNGFYRMTNVTAGNYSVFASLAGYEFNSRNPVQLSVPPDATNVNFTVTRRYFILSGKVDGLGNLGLGGVTMTASSPSGTNVQLTHADGSHSFSVDATNTYTFQPSFRGFTFIPPSRTVLVPADATNTFFDTNVNFLAGPFITSVSLTNGVIQLIVSAPAGLNHIEITTNLNPANWQTALSTNTHGASYKFVDPIATNSPLRFYRAAYPQ
jgi:hypothetical protein